MNQTEPTKTQLNLIKQDPTCLLRTKSDPTEPNRSQPDHKGLKGPQKGPKGPTRPGIAEHLPGKQSGDKTIAFLFFLSLFWQARKTRPISAHVA